MADHKIAIETAFLVSVFLLDDTNVSLLCVLRSISHPGILPFFAIPTWLYSWVVTDSIWRDCLGGYTTQIVTSLVVLSTNQSPSFALKCMIEGVAFATGTDGQQTIRCDEISHQHLIPELFLAQDRVVGCAQHNCKPIIHCFSCSLYTAAVVFSVEYFNTLPLTLICCLLSPLPSNPSKVQTCCVGIGLKDTKVQGCIPQDSQSAVPDWERPKILKILRHL
eukprot:10463387-Ditylum_brightwellii.AAC.1